MTRTRRPKVVIENPRPHAAADQRDALVEAGFDVEICAGPGPDGIRGCALLDRGRCGLLDQADAVLYDLDIEDEVDHEILATMRRRYPRLPVVVELPSATARHHAELLAGVHVTVPYSRDHLRDTMLAALDA